MLSKKLTIDKIGAKLKNAKVLIRVDYNVPMKNGKISDLTRIKESLPTIKYALDNGAKTIALISHLGRPDGNKNLKYTLAPVAPELANLLNRPVEFLNDCVGDSVYNSVKSGNEGKIFLLENLRFYPAEEGSRVDENKNKIKESVENIVKFRNELTRLGDIFVNDAFGTAHRAHSSMVGCQQDIRY